ncbi:arylesterase [Bdellovibrio sp. qaytius]|nr:arylesterase [Bdellovibrio sp. qaytius]
MKLLYTILTTTLFSLAVFANPNTTTQSSPKKFIILGDSLTEGYGVAQSAAFPALLQKKVEQDKLNWKIISSGSSGSTSASGLQRIKWIAKSKPDMVLVLLGSNDGLRGLKPEETEKNLNDTVEWAKQNNIEVSLGQLHVPPNYGKDYEKKFSAVYAKVAAKNKIQLAPFLLDKVAGQKDLNLADGIHPNEKGHQIVADNLYPFVKKLISK